MKQLRSRPTAPATLTAPGLARQGKCPQRGIKTTLHEQLQEQFHHLSFPAFEQLVQQLLARSGFIQVDAPGRHYAKGRLTHGGLDISAYGSTDLTDSLTIIQLKQYRDGVPRRFVDELRGVMPRTGARHGLLITTSHFSPAAETAANADGLAPIRLIAGRELSELLIQHSLGIRQRANGHPALDRRFFRQLETSAQNQRPPRGKADHAVSGAAPSPTAPIASPSQSPNLVAPLPARGAGAQKGTAMTWSTHVLCGISSLWLLQAIPPSPLLPTADPATFALLVGAAALGALLPDLDAAESKIKHLKIGGIKPFYLPAQFVHRQLGHRGLAHSLSGLIMVALLALPLITWWGWAASAALVLGYASHLVADACTKSGIPFFYPNRYRYHLLPPGWRFTTGSQAEEVLFPFLAMAVLLLLLSHLFALMTMPL